MFSSPAMLSRSSLVRNIHGDGDGSLLLISYMAATRSLVGEIFLRIACALGLLNCLCLWFFIQPIQP
jgi:hypothetical protein